MSKPTWLNLDVCSATSVFFVFVATELGNGVMRAIGLVETKGLIGLVAATDAMMKAANVIANSAEGVLEAFLANDTSSPHAP
jgi:hypothetical protein